MPPLADILICLRFLSRLPLPATRREVELGSSGLSQAAAYVSLAGAIIGMIPAIVLRSALGVGLPPLLAAPLAIAALIAVTGGLHEDGLADCADGFGGGRTRARKLDIMRDSRIGTFGACAIALSLYIRAAGLGFIAARSPWLATGVLVTAAGLSRALCLLPLLLLPPARSDGLGAVAGRPTAGRIAAATAIAIGLGLATLLPGSSVIRFSLAIVLAGTSALVLTALAARQIGGQTGDVAGAAQQVSDIAFILVFAAS